MAKSTTNYSSLSSPTSGPRSPVRTHSSGSINKISVRAYTQPAEFDLRLDQSLLSQVKEVTDIRTLNPTRIKHRNNLAKVKLMLSRLEDSVESMKIIDLLQRLGIDHRFKEEIGDMLLSRYAQFGHHEDDIFHVALSFRLLRQAGHYVSSDVFYKFVDEKGEFKVSLKTNIKGLLSLYEASYLNTGEEILYKAREFSSKHLVSCARHLDTDIASLVTRTLQHPFHKTLSRYNLPYYIDEVRRKSVSGLAELASEDFNRIQEVHRRELTEFTSWWKQIGLAQELSFTRDQPLKWYTWGMTVLPESQFSDIRIDITKVITFVYVIDDTFDVYGSVEDLTLFTEAVTKWELSAVETLPGYMQICYMTLYNITNDIALATYRQHGFNPIYYLKELWGRLCKAFLKESKWLRSMQIPKADEYLRNAIVSSGVCTVLLHAYFLLGQGITKENADFLLSNPTLLSSPATILRLWDDLGTAKDENQEGLDGSYVEYLMKERPDYSMEIASDHVMKMISSSWESLNKECFSSGHFAPNLVTVCLNFARMVEVMYSYDKCQTLPILEDYVSTLLFKKI